MRKNFYKWLIVFFFAIDLQIFANEIDVQCKAFLSKDSLLIKIKFYNKSLNDIYLQNQFWEFGGSEVTNYFPFYPGRGYIVNTVYMIHGDSNNVEFRSEKMEYPHLKFIEKPIKIKANNEIEVTVLLKYNLQFNKKIKLHLRFPYFEDSSIIHTQHNKDFGNNVFINLYHEEIRNEIICEDQKFKKYLSDEYYQNNENIKYSGFLGCWCEVEFNPNEAKE